MGLAQQGVILSHKLLVVRHGVAKQADDGSEERNEGDCDENGLDNGVELQMGSLSLSGTCKAHKEQAGVQ